MAQEPEKQCVKPEDLPIEERKNTPDVVIVVECFAVSLKLGKNSADLSEYVHHATKKIDEGAGRLPEQLCEYRLI